MAFTTQAVPATLPAKRKRTCIDYATPYDSAYESGGEVDGAMAFDDDISDDDGLYGGRKKPSKKTKGEKKATKRSKIAAAKPKKPQKPFPFMSLPPELRDWIYELALTEPRGIALVSNMKAFRRTVVRGEVRQLDHANNWATPCSECTYSVCMRPQKELSQNKQLVPSLLAVSKQMNAETVGYLYQQPIILEDTMALHTFIAAIGQSNCRQLTDLTVVGWGEGHGAHKTMNVAGLTSLAACTNLKSFFLDFEIAYSRKPRDFARQIYRDGHYFLEAYGAANGKKDAAVEILSLKEHKYNRDHYCGLRRALPEPKQFKMDFQKELRRLLGCIPTVGIH